MHKIAVFIRCAYDQPLTERRLLLFQQTINSLKAQVFKFFDVYVITGGIWKQQGNRENTERIANLDWGQLNVFLLPDKDIPKHSYNIQIRLDSDDWINPLYILKCVDLYERTEAQNFIITFTPYFYENGYFYIRRNSTLKERPSAFSVICQKGTIQRWCYEVAHTKLAEMIKDVIVVELGFCFANIHDGNLSTKIFPTDRRIEI